MFKKAGIIAAATAGLLLAGAPAFADSPLLGGIGNGDDSNEQFGLLNTSDLDVADTVTVPICANDTNVDVGIIVAAVVDLLSPSGQAGSCNAAVVNENGDR